MFFKMINDELKKQFKSVTFYIFFIVLIVYYITQFVPPTSNDPLKPIPSNLESNGTKRILADELNEMTFVYYRMNYNLENGAIAKFNLGFKKWNRLNEEQKTYLKQIRDKIYGHQLDDNGSPETLVSYNEFHKILEEMDKRLGGNTVYNSKYRDNIFWDIFYGYKTIEEQDLKVRAGYIELNSILNMNEYLRMSPILNWHKELSDNQRASIEMAVKRISPDGIDENGNLINPVDYDEYESILDELDKKIGDKTIFSKENREQIYRQNKTYNDAMKEFNDILNYDKITNAYGRIFSDYMGITAGLYPVFLVIAVFLRDKKRGIPELIKDREISPFIYMLSKYIATCISLMICYLLLATHSTFIFYNISKSYNYLVDLGAFYKYTLVWIAPTVLFTVAISMFIYAVFNKITPTIIVQLSLWFLSIQTLGGDYRLHRFIIRFNSLGNYTSYTLGKSSILSNRIFYTILSLGIIMITAYIYKHRMVKTSSDIL